LTKIRKILQSPVGNTAGVGCMGDITEEKERERHVKRVVPRNTDHWGHTSGCWEHCEFPTFACRLQCTSSVFKINVIISTVLINNSKELEIL
jgi:hypothetical protein